MGSRQIKRKVLEILALPDLDDVLTGLEKFAAKDCVNALFAGICRSEELLRWHAISAMGVAVDRLAVQDMEEARIIMRRFLWSLNDESGGIGWGAPESMAEVMHHNRRLAEEYIHMLVSYMQEDGEELFQDGNFLEHETLQCGLLWGIGRLSKRRGDMLRKYAISKDLQFYLQSADPAVRGMAARAFGLLGADDMPSSVLDTLQALQDDGYSMRLYEDGRLSSVTVGDLADQALERLGK